MAKPATEKDKKPRAPRRAKPVTPEARQHATAGQDDARQHAAGSREKPAADARPGEKLPDPTLLRRVVVEGVHPEVDAGRFPIKRTAGEDVVVHADIFTDGHDTLAASLLYRRSGEHH